VKPFGGLFVLPYCPPVSTLSLGSQRRDLADLVPPWDDSVAALATQNRFCTRPATHEGHDLAFARPLLQDSFGLHSRTSPDVFDRLRPVSRCACVGQISGHQIVFAATILQYKGWKKAPREFWFKGTPSFCVEEVLRAGSFAWESRYLYVTFATHAAFQQKLPEIFRTGPCGRTSCPAWLVRGRSVPVFCIAHGARDWLRNRPSSSLKAAPPYSSKPLFTS